MGSGDLVSLVATALYFKDSHDKFSRLLENDISGRLPSDTYRTAASKILSDYIESKRDRELELKVQEAQRNAFEDARGVQITSLPLELENAFEMHLARHGKELDERLSEFKTDMTHATSGWKQFGVAILAALFSGVGGWLAVEQANIQITPKTVYQSEKTK